MTVGVTPLTGGKIASALPALARLRMAVFREWPYLYDGTLAYEHGYLSKFGEARGAIIAAALDGEEIVGCATAAPLAEVEEEFSTPFRERGLDPSNIFYCGESVLLPAYRGQGLGHAFFDQREARGRALGGFTHCTFCAVVRPEEHPLRPDRYRPLDAFWTKRGYARIEGMTTQFAWKDIDQPRETSKTMQFWMKAL